MASHMASPLAMSGLRATVSRETREPPDPPAITAGPRSSWRISAARVSACSADSVEPENQTLEAPQLGRSQMRTRRPRSTTRPPDASLPGPLGGHEVQAAARRAQ